MKLNLVKSALLVLVAALLVACASAPKKLSAEECLVVIPTSMENNTNLIFPRNFYLQFSDKQQEKMILQNAQDVIIVVVKGPGVKVTGIRSSVDTSKGFRGPNGYQKADLELPYVPGRLVVAYQGYNLTMHESGAHTYTADAILKTFDNSSVDALYEKYKAKKDFAAWFED